MTTPRTLADELGLPAGTPLVDWCTAWSTSTSTPAGVLNADGNVVDEQLTDALAGYATTHGKGDAFAGAEASTCTVSLVRELAGRVPAVGEPVRLALHPSLADALGVPSAGRTRFTGEVVGRQVVDDVLSVQLVGRRSRLGRLYVGDTPWPDESDGARAERILQLALAQLSSLQLGDVDVGTVQLLPRDVDRQPALGLLDSLAEDSAGQLVELRNGDLSWHDAEHRRNLPAVVELGAGQLVSDLTWSSGIDGMVNDLTLVYGPDVEGADRATVRQVDEAMAGPLGVGPIEARVDTQLALADQAVERARLIVGRRSRALWETPALTVELLRTVSRAQLVQLLQLQQGDVVRVTGLPSMGPFTTSRLAVEGWTEQLTRQAWQLQLVAADLGIAGAPVRWVDVPPSITWADLADDPELAGMTWLQAARWQPDADPRGRWVDQPADLFWRDVDPGLTWATYPTT